MIKASSGGRIDALIADLGSERAIVREAAIARLIVSGPRAVERLRSLSLDPRIPVSNRIAALRALEGIDDPRSLDAALASLNDPDVGVALAAIGVASAFVTRPRGLPAVDRLTAIAVDPRQQEAVRVAAVQALGDLRPATLRPMMRSLKGDPSGAVRALARSGRASAKTKEAKQDTVRRAIAGALPESPNELRRDLETANGLSISDLVRLIEAVRERERTSTARDQEAWLEIRGRIHAMLAARGSGIAIYDLRDTLAKNTGALPEDFWLALNRVGDVTCLEPIAQAFESSRPGGSKTSAWRAQLARAFRSIVDRERLTRRHRAIKKLELRRPAALTALWTTAPTSRP